MSDNQPETQAENEGEPQNQIWVVTAETGAVRSGGRRLKQFSAEELSVNINLFLEQMGKTLEKTPQKIGPFQFVEFEVSAELTAKGSLALMGTGGEAGASSGIKFVFRRPSSGS